MFRLKNQKNGTDYFLVFGTNQREHLEKMKESFWKIYPSFGSSFSDFDNPGRQLYLIPPEPDYTRLPLQLIQRFEHTTASISEIDEYVAAETPFYGTAYRKHVLKHLEDISCIRITTADPTRKSGDYSETEHIHFLKL